MPMVRLKAPPHATSLSAYGEEYKVKDGFLEIPELLTPVAEAHGYGKRAEKMSLDQIAAKAVGQQTAEDVANMSRGDLLVYCEEKKLEVKSGINIGELRKLVWADMKEKQDFLRKVQPQT